MCCTPDEILMLQTVSAVAGLSLVCGVAFPVLPAAWVNLRSAVKTTSIALLAGIAALLGAPLLALALVASALGDLALSRPGSRAFLLGMVAFGAAHLIYVFLFVAMGNPATLVSIPRAIAALCVIGLALTVALHLSKTAGSFADPLRAYIGVIAAMGLAALSLPMDQGGAWVMAGAALFMTSDILIGHEKFAGLRFVGLGLAIWGLYYVGQVLILLGVLAQM